MSESKSSILNLYELIPKDIVKGKRTYKNWEQVQIELPFRMLVVGAAGSMKTNSVVNIALAMNCWNKVYIFAKQINEPLYKWLAGLYKEAENELGIDIVFVSDELDDMPELEEIDPRGNNLFIFDDLILEKAKKLKTVEALFVRGRRLNCSCIFVSQRYYQVPIMIRQNADYLVIKKVLVKDRDRILREFAQDITAEELVKKCQQATKDRKEDFMLIDTVHPDPRYRYRKNFEPI
jgi:hypothetical protein